MGKLEFSSSIRTSRNGKFSSFKDGFIGLKTFGAVNLRTLKKYGERGVEILKEETPKEGGETSNSWYYEIEIKGRNTATLEFHNDNIKNGLNIAIILQNGHATRSGSWYPGIDYVGPAMDRLSDEITNSL